jgi:predicted lysophospholipase L1 biosynthesis ABC-type transport system permease subunit
MFKVFQLTLVRNWRSILLLFVVLVLASTGFLVLRQLTANIEKQVVVQTQPLFGADIRISSRSSNSGSLFSIFSPYLTGTAYSWAERISFSTTLFDREGKTGLIQVIAYTGTYPQR